MNKCIKNCFFINIIFILLIHLCSCGPKIYNFQVESKVVTATDSIRVHWRTRGKSTLLIHEKFKAVQNDSIKIVELTLVTEKSNKLVRRFLQVEVREDQLVDSIIFSTQVESDSVIVAKGMKSADRWNKYQVLSVTNPSARPLLVKHSGRQFLLKPLATSTEAFNSTPVAGDWEFRSTITEAEKRDPSKLPSTLKIITLIKEANGTR
jgi:hypothetical protein